jgi:predicted nuclease with TOPRIM domain
MQEEYQRIAAERNNANEELNELFAEKSEKDIVIKTLTNENLELNTRITSLESKVVAKEDQDAKYDQLYLAY